MSNDELTEALSEVMEISLVLDKRTTRPTNNYKFTNISDRYSRDIVSFKITAYPDCCGVVIVHRFYTYCHSKQITQEMIDKLIKIITEFAHSAYSRSIAEYTTSEKQKQLMSALEANGWKKFPMGGNRIHGGRTLYKWVHAAEGYEYKG